MKIRVPNLAEIMLGVALGGLLLIGGFLTARAMEPPRLQWEALRVVNAPVAERKLIIEAETMRRDSTECTNGVQADMRDRAGVVTRLPAPVRELQPNGDARYEVALPEDVLPGFYGVRLRESFYCDGRPDTVVAPWLEFQVVK